MPITRTNSRNKKQQERGRFLKKERNATSKKKHLEWKESWRKQDRKKNFLLELTQLGKCFGKFNWEGAVYLAQKDPSYHPVKLYYLPSNTCCDSPASPSIYRRSFRGMLQGFIFANRTFNSFSWGLIFAKSD